MQDETQREEELRDEGLDAGDGDAASASEDTGVDETTPENAGDGDTGTEDTGDGEVKTGDGAIEQVPEEETPEEVEARQEAGIATAEENAALQHTDGDASATTRDGTDAGVPMLPGDPSEPQGPEDALGVGDKRGDYETRVDGPHAESVPVEGGGEPIKDDDGNTVDLKPKSRLVSQNDRVAERGEVPGEKGGVTTG